ncbi:hypothetical protein FRB94_013185 [Tulasnella sp. JGI-2019a]|nr:hypothetical protein FRB94_013185 [Tulasnella sp. JGI-2019a]
MWAQIILITPQAFSLQLSFCLTAIQHSPFPPSSAYPSFLPPLMKHSYTLSLLPQFSSAYFKVLTFSETFLLHLPHTYPISTICRTSWSQFCPSDMSDEVLCQESAPY